MGSRTAAKRRANALVAWSGLLLLAGNCVPAAGSDGPSTKPNVPDRSTAIRLYVPHTARALGAVLPVLVEVDLQHHGPPEERCVKLRGKPGTASFAFGSTCGAAGAPSGEGGAGSEATGCLGFENTSGDKWLGSTLGSYEPAADEDVVTLFGAVYETSSCDGTPADQNVLVVHLGDDEPSAGGMGEGGNATGGMSASGGSAGSGSGGDPTPGGGGQGG